MKKIILMALSVLFLFFSFSEDQKKGLLTDHFDGKRYFNDMPDHSFSDMVKWLWEMERVQWPEWINDKPQKRPLKYVEGENLKITYVNQSTLLIQTDGINLLSDPMWSFRSSPVSWAGPKRIRAPGIKIDDLPEIDVVLISHDHYDHLDIDSLIAISKKSNPVILTGLGIKNLLQKEGFKNVTELDWWQEQKIKSGKAKITFVPAQHSSGRTLFGKNRTLWGGFVIEGKAGKIYFSGDTGYGNFLLKIKEKFISFRLAIFPIGSYEKRWFMKREHMDPEDAVKAHILLKSKQSVGMHYATFIEHPEQSIDAHEKDLKFALKKFSVSETDFRILKFGEGFEVEK